MGVEGQKEMLAGFGITEEAMGCPIKSSMEVVELGYSSLGKRVVLDKAPILFAIPCIENAYDETAVIEAILPENILEREAELLEVAKANMPSLIVGEGDVLVVDEIGKNYSGTGVDPNITGTFSTDFAHGGIQVQRTAFLNLSEISHGNALGVGLASAITSSPHAVARGTPTRAARGHAAGAQRWFADHGIGAPARVSSEPSSGMGVENTARTRAHRKDTWGRGGARTMEMTGRGARQGGPYRREAGGRPRCERPFHRMAVDAVGYTAQPAFPTLRRAGLSFFAAFLLSRRKS